MEKIRFLIFDMKEPILNQKMFVNMQKIWTT